MKSSRLPFERWEMKGWIALGVYTLTIAGIIAIATAEVAKVVFR